MDFPHIGELNKQVQVRRRSDLPAADMGLDQTFPEQLDRWAKIEPVGSAIYAGSVQIDTIVTHRIFIRYLAGVTNAHEVVHGARLYRVQRVTDLNGAGRFTVLEVEELSHGA
ncbi:phage head closure protein [Cupriavidus oxalaticus]|uniref:Head-tail adaptor protein n=1 Tax=Cupriavidus oxalaticus TaxID=96344 RepID=A0A4P7LU52_9BURK|nr:phage head closure protein [Cupriavidus oxalaticus]QBY56147.1 head-tail adaptor protein [Cupriavidus oxalaticus]